MPSLSPHFTCLPFRSNRTWSLLKRPAIDQSYLIRFREGGGPGIYPWLSMKAVARVSRDGDAYHIVAPGWPCEVTAYRNCMDAVLDMIRTFRDGAVVRDDERSAIDSFVSQISDAYAWARQLAAREDIVFSQRDAPVQTLMALPQDEALQRGIAVPWIGPWQVGTTAIRTSSYFIRRAGHGWAVCRWSPGGKDAYFPTFGRALAGLVRRQARDLHGQASAHERARWLEVQQRIKATFGAARTRAEAFPDPTSAKETAILWPDLSPSPC